MTEYLLEHVVQVVGREIPPQDQPDFSNVCCCKAMFDKLSSSLLSARKSVKLIGISDGASGTCQQRISLYPNPDKLCRKAADSPSFRTAFKSGPGDTLVLRLTGGRSLEGEEKEGKVPHSQNLKMGLLNFSPPPSPYWCQGGMEDFQTSQGKGGREHNNVQHPLSFTSKQGTYTSCYRSIPLLLLVVVGRKFRKTFLTGFCIQRRRTNTLIPSQSTVSPRLAHSTSRKVQKEQKSRAHLFPLRLKGWRQKVGLCSGAKKLGKRRKKPIGLLSRKWNLKGTESVCV